MERCLFVKIVQPCTRGFDWANTVGRRWLANRILDIEPGAGGKVGITRGSHCCGNQEAGGMWPFSMVSMVTKADGRGFHGILRSVGGGGLEHIDGWRNNQGFNRGKYTPSAVPG